MTYPQVQTQYWSQQETHAASPIFQAIGAIAAVIRRQPSPFRIRKCVRRTGRINLRREIPKLAERTVKANVTAVLRALKGSRRIEAAIAASKLGLATEMPRIDHRR